MKAMLMLLIVLLAGLFGHYYLENQPQELKYNIELGGVIWPKNIKYELDKAGDVTIVLKEAFKAYKGTWPKGTRFKFDGDDISTIEPKESFEFAEMKFKKPMTIKAEKDGESYIFMTQIKTKTIIDGLDLDPGCSLVFKNYVLTSAKCERFGSVDFKRSIDLPVNSEGDLENVKSNPNN